MGTHHSTLTGSVRCLTVAGGGESAADPIVDQGRLRSVAELAWSPFRQPQGSTCYWHPPHLGLLLVCFVEAHQDTGSRARRTTWRTAAGILWS
jgi:hypothetical protein